MLFLFLFLFLLLSDGGNVNALVIPSTTRSKYQYQQHGFLVTSTIRPAPFSRLYYQRNITDSDVAANVFSSSPSAPTTATSATAATPATDSPMERFQRRALNLDEVDNKECIITMNGGKRYNLTAWAYAHPGGLQVLRKFHSSGKDATKAFEAAHHSQSARDMLQRYLIIEDEDHDDEDRDDDTPTPSASNAVVLDDVVDESTRSTGSVVTTATSSSSSTTSQSSHSKLIVSRLRRVRRKLFTKEDPIGIHKYLGLFVLGNYLCRYYQMYFAKNGITAGLGSSGGWFAVMCLLPHTLLSLSSLIFNTVPKERVIGKPMIWQEYRIHNIVFAMRSVVTTLANAICIKAYGNQGMARRLAVAVCCTAVIASQLGADAATRYLQPRKVDSTTATTPYWDGCSIETQQNFKTFYAYCQFMATLACLGVGNPAWSFSVMMPIQMASLLLTLVRKGFVSAKGFHYGYTATLIAPYFVGIRSLLYTSKPDFVYVMIAAATLYQLRRRGVNKYKLWIPVVIGRFFWGDLIMTDPKVW